MSHVNRNGKEVWEPKSLAYKELTQETLDVVSKLNPKTKDEAEIAFFDLYEIPNFSSFDHYLLAKDMFLKAYCLGRHGERLE